MTYVSATPAIELLTVAEAAERLRRTESQLRWMIHCKTAPPSALIGGRRMFRAADLEQWIDAQFAQQAS